jgi:hypothetical protein
VIYDSLYHDEVVHNFISRRGAERAEAAEGFCGPNLTFSAISASSAPLRETNIAPFGVGGAA